jgi:hypothetical protein
MIQKKKNVQHVRKPTQPLHGMLLLAITASLAIGYVFFILQAHRSFIFSSLKPSPQYAQNVTFSASPSPSISLSNSIFPSAEVGTETTAWKAYASKKLHYHIEVPSTWLVQQFEDEPNWVQQDRQVNMSLQPYAQIGPEEPEN